MRVRTARMHVLVPPKIQADAGKAEQTGPKECMKKKKKILEKKKIPDPSVDATAGDRACNHNQASENIHQPPRIPPPQIDEIIGSTRQRCGSERRFGPVRIASSLLAPGAPPVAVAADSLVPEVGVIVMPAPSSVDRSSRRSPLCTESFRACPNDRRTSSVSCSVARGKKEDVPRFRTWFMTDAWVQYDFFSSFLCTCFRRISNTSNLCRMTRADCVAWGWEDGNRRGSVKVLLLESCPPCVYPRRSYRVNADAASSTFPTTSTLVQSDPIFLCCSLIITLASAGVMIRLYMPLSCTSSRATWNCGSLSSCFRSTMLSGRYLK